MKYLLMIMMTICLAVTGCSRTSTTASNETQTLKAAQSKPDQIKQQTKEEIKPAESDKEAPATPSPQSTASNTSATQKADAKNSETTVSSQVQQKPAAASYIKILSPAEGYVQSADLDISWQAVPGGWDYTLTFYDLTDNKQILIDHALNGSTHYTIKNSYYYNGPNGGEWTTYLKENHQVRLDIYTFAGKSKVESKDIILSVNSLKVKPVFVTYPMNGTVLSAAEIKDYVKVAMNGPDRSLDYNMGVWDETDKTWVKSQDSIEKDMVLSPNALIPGHKYTVSVSCWYSIDDHLRDRPEIFHTSTSFSTADK